MKQFCLALQHNKVILNKKCSVPGKSDSGRSQVASSSPQAGAVKTNILAGGSVGPVIAFKAGVPEPPNPGEALTTAETRGAAMPAGISLVQMKESFSFVPAHLMCQCHC